MVDLAECISDDAAGRHFGRRAPGTWSVPSLQEPDHALIDHAVADKFAADHPDRALP
jgi:hypothetical protein